MADVVVPLRHAVESGFPAICAITGGTADGAVALRVGRTWKRWNSPKVRVPLSEPIFDKWTMRQNIHIKARALASVLTAIGVVIAFRNGLLAISVLAVAVVIHLVDLWAERTVGNFQPTLTRRGTELVLSGVHPRFAEAVDETVWD
jgi:hypothetical protein